MPIVFFPTCPYLFPEDITDLSFEFVPTEYEPPGEIVIQLGHRDVKLGAFTHNAKQHIIKNLTSGDSLFPGEQEHTLYNSAGRAVLYFSKHFSTELQDKWLNKGYRIDSAQARFIIIWKDPTEEKEYRIVLPNLRLKKEMG